MYICTFCFRHKLFDVSKGAKKKITMSKSTSNFSFNRLFSSSSRLTSFFNFSFSLKVPPTLPDSKIKLPSCFTGKRSESKGFCKWNVIHLESTSQPQKQLPDLQGEGV